MFDTRRVVRSVVSAGLGFALAVGPALPALAEDATNELVLPVGEYASPDYADATSRDVGSTGDTSLYVTAQKSDLTVPEGHPDGQVKVTIPVAIHYVADSRGMLTGPSDNTVKFVNHAKVGPVHISKIAVEGVGGAKIVTSDKLKNNDDICLSMKPTQGQSNQDGSAFVPGKADEGQSDEFRLETTTDELGRYVVAQGRSGKTPINRDDWNIAQKDGALALNNLTGQIKGFQSIDPSTDSQVGVIHWTVRPGLRVDADWQDTNVTIRFNTNNGSTASGRPIANQCIEVLEPGSLPQEVPVLDVLDTPLEWNETLVPPMSAANGAGAQEVEFLGWNTMPDGSGLTIESLGNFQLSEADLAGTVRELYAIFGVPDAQEG